jgi:transcriptional regulator with XRE-family HTH domain
MPERANAIGEYLQARRALITPEDVGIKEFGRRRVKGLRREEVAMLAGLSADYYVRLEQGRDRHPSEQVLDALARALQLGTDATQHLHRLARPSMQRKRTPHTPERAPAGAVLLIASWSETPAYIHGRYLDVLAANPLATAVLPFCQVGANLVRAVFFDPAARELFDEWERVTEAGAASLRALVGPNVDDPRLTELVGELSIRSQRFRELWGRHDVKPKAPGQWSLQHPLVGPLNLRFENLTIEGSNGLTLVAYHAEPDSETAQKLALLASLAARQPHQEDPAPAPQPN